MKAAGQFQRTRRRDRLRDRERCLAEQQQGTSSPSSRSKLTIFPMRGRRTPSLPKTRLYSRRISSLTSQTNVSPSIQFRSRLALGFLGAIAGAFSPAIPATRTDVSTTPLGRFRFCPGNDSDLRRLLSSRAVFTNGFQNLFL